MADKVKVYALSTCGWCKKTVGWLEDNNVAFEKVYVDLTEGDEREQLVAEVKQYNPRASFPTVVIDDGAIVIIGFKPDDLGKELL